MTTRRKCIRLIYSIFITLFVVKSITSEQLIDKNNLVAESNLSQNILRSKENASDNNTVWVNGASSNNNVNDINVRQERLLETAVHYLFGLHRQHKSRFR